jgi:hypothetical protein
MSIKELAEKYISELKTKDIALAFTPDPYGFKSPTKFISDDDMNSTIRTIIDNLPNGIEGFQLAAQLYDSDFFENETPIFKSALSTALMTKYPEFKNFYWVKLSQAQENLIVK